MSSKKSVLLALLCLLFTVMVTPVFAEDEWYLDKPIKSISIQNLNVLKASDLEGVTSSFIKKPFTYELVSDLVNRLFDLNYFEDIVPSVVPGDSNKSTVNLILSMKEYPVVRKIVFKGNDLVRTSELKEKISLKENEIFVKSNVLKDVRSLTYLYTEKGFSNIKITSSYDDSKEDVVVTFEIEEGKQTVVKSIQFEGNSLVSSKTLKGKISLKEVGFFNNGSFQDSSIEQDKKTIVTYYQDRGYVEASILDVKKEVIFNEEKKRDEVNLTFVIQEGSQYTFGGITFSGNKIFTTDQLQKLVKLKAGALYNVTKIQESISAVEALYSENGYLYNQYSFTPLKDSENNIISYTLSIVENPRAHVENVIIKGNTKTKEEIIRREIPMESGDIYSSTNVATAFRSLANLRYFSNVTPNITYGSEDGLVDVTFAVEEASTTQLEGTLTFTGVTNPNDFPVSVSAKISDTNLFGTGRSVSASATLSTTQQSLSLGYGQNWLFGIPLSLSASIGYTHETDTTLINHYLPNGDLDSKNYYMEYQQNELNFSYGMGYRWTYGFGTLTLSGGLSGSLVNNKYDSVRYTPVDSSISEYNDGWFPKNSIWASFSADGRDIAFDSSNGWFASERLTWNGLFPQGILPFAPEWGETQFYLRSDTKAEYYKTLFNVPVTDSWSLKMVLMAYSGFSFQLPVASNIKKSNMLYIDGMLNGRGWGNYNYVNGEALWNNTLELRMPVIPSILAVDLFADASMIKPKFQDTFTDFTNKDDWYFSFGPSLRFLIQQIPLRFLFASTFKIDDDGLAWKDRLGGDVDSFMDSFHFVLSFSFTNN